MAVGKILVYYIVYQTVGKPKHVAQCLSNLRIFIQRILFVTLYDT